MSYRIYGRAGEKVVKGVINDQFGGEQALEVDDKASGYTTISSRPNARLISYSEANGNETSDAFVVTSKNLQAGDLTDLSNSSSVGVVNLEQENSHRHKMTTGVEISKNNNI